MIPETFFERLKVVVAGVQHEGTNIFSEVKIVPLFERSSITNMRFPFALIRVRDFINDPENPEFGEQYFSILMFTQTKTEKFAEHSLIGSGNTLGLFTITQKVYEAITETHTLTDSLAIIESKTDVIQFPKSNYGVKYQILTMNVLLDAFNA